MDAKIVIIIWRTRLIINFICTHWIMDRRSPVDYHSIIFFPKLLVFTCNGSTLCYMCWCHMTQTASLIVIRRRCLMLTFPFLLFDLTVDSWAVFFSLIQTHWNYLMRMSFSLDEKRNVVISNWNVFVSSRSNPKSLNESQSLIYLHVEEKMKINQSKNIDFSDD